MIISFKKFFQPLKYISNWQLLMLCLVLIISSLDGIVNAQLFGTVAKINAENYKVILIKTILLGVLGYGIVFTAIMWGERIKNKIIQDSLVALKSKYINENFYQNKVHLNNDELINTVLNDAKILEQNYFQALFTFIYQLSMAFFSAIYLFSINIPLAIVFIICSLFAMLPAMLLGNKVKESASIWSKSNEIFVKKFRELLTGRNTLLTYGSNPMMLNMNQQLVIQEENYKKMNNKAILAAWIGWMGSIISFMGPIIVGIMMISRGSSMTGSMLVSMLLASDRIIGPLRQGMQQFTLIKTTEEIRNKLISSKEGPRYSQSMITTKNFKQLSVKDASIKYSDTKILFFPDIVIKNHDKILITGVSGSGKTTFLNLVQGYLKPHSGKIEVLTEDGLNSPALDIFATISQESFLINDTIKNNLTLGHNFSNESCLQVLKNVGLFEELGENILEYNAGENGSNLSGGQRQRIAIARALLFKKPIILADEITANLDNNAAKKVREALYQTGLTIVEVAHHFSEEVMKKNNFKIYNIVSKK